MDQFKRDSKKFTKKQPTELKHMLLNLGRFFEALNNNIPLCNITGGYIHIEPNGVKALDQRGPTKGKLKQTRLYIYPDITLKTLYLLAIGDKETQAKDIKYTQNWVKKLNKERKSNNE